MTLYESAKRKHKLNSLLEKDSKDDIFNFLDKVFEKPFIQNAIRPYDGLYILSDLKAEPLLSLQLYISNNQVGYVGVFDLSYNFRKQCVHFLKDKNINHSELQDFINLYIIEKFNLGNKMSIDINKLNIQK